MADDKYFEKIITRGTHIKINNEMKPALEPLSNNPSPNTPNNLTNTLNFSSPSVICVSTQLLLLE